MVIFHFPEHKHELFWRYFGSVDNFLAQCGYCMENWRILSVINEGVNGETRALSEYFGFFFPKNVDKAMDLLE